MTWHTRFASRFLALFQKRRLDRELDEELRLHLEMQIEDNIEDGMSPEEARRAARRTFGGVEQIKEEYRDRRAIRLVESLAQDIRFGLRRLASRPGFVAVVVLTLALGIGANTAVFSGVHFALIEMIEAASPGELFWVWLSDTQHITSFALYEELRSVPSPFVGFCAVSRQPTTVRTGEITEQLPVELTTSEYFPLLGIAAELGRVFGEADRDSPVAVLEHSFWRERFAGNPDAIGRTVDVTGRPYTIIGVAPEGFRGLAKDSKPALWIPMEQTAHVLPDLERWRNPYPGLIWLQVFARLPSDADQAAAHAAANLALSRYVENAAEQNPSPYAATMRKYRVRLMPAGFGNPVKRDQAAKTLKLLGAIVALILLLACANVANLMLGRASMRRQEIAIQLALGSGRFRIVRQLLVESLLLALLGGIAGMLLAWTCTPWIGALLDLNEDIPLSLPVLGFTAALSLASGILFGVAPAWVASDISLGGWLKGGGLGVRERNRGARGVLVAVQVALCIPVLVAAGLVLQTLRNLHSVSTGLMVEQTVQGEVNPRASGYDVERSMYVLDELQTRLADRPEVRSAAFGRATAFSGDLTGRNLVREDSDERVAQGPVRYSWISNDYFITLGIPLLAGRTFAKTDTKEAPRVIVVNETLARLVAGDESAVGRRVRSSTIRPILFTIVGVVADNVHESPRDKVDPFLYLPVAQAPISRATVYVRAAGSPEAVTKILRAELAALDPYLPMTELRPMTESVSQSLRAERRLGAMLSAFGSIGLLIVAVGLYGVLSYAVARRTREIGLRKALGAQQADITGMVVRRGLVWVSAGMLVGAGLAWAARELIQATLFGLEPTDPTVYLGSGALLLAVAAFAAFLPARHAARIEPMQALRHD